MSMLLLQTALIFVLKSLFTNYAWMNYTLNIVMCAAMVVTGVDVGFWANSVIVETYIFEPTYCP